VAALPWSTLRPIPAVRGIQQLATHNPAGAGLHDPCSRSAPGRSRRIESPFDSSRSTRCPPPATASNHLASFNSPEGLASFPLLLLPPVLSAPVRRVRNTRARRALLEGEGCGDDDPRLDGAVRAVGREGGHPGGGRGGAARDGAPHLAALPRGHRREVVVAARGSAGAEPAASGAEPSAAAAAGGGLPRDHGHDGVQVQEGDLHPEPHGPRAVPARPRGGAVAGPGGRLLRARGAAGVVGPGAEARDAGLHQVGVRVQQGLRVQRVRRQLVVPVVGDDRGRKRVERTRRRRFVVPDAPAGGRRGQLREAAAVIVWRRAEAQVPRARALGERRRRQVRGRRWPLPLLQAQVSWNPSLLLVLSW
jgi:hypothetical protein